MKPAEKTPRVYVPPRLIVYGDLTAITLNNVSNNMNDKGTGSFSMT
jgi:hypothetical protein